MMGLYGEIYSIITRSKGFEDLTVPCNYLEEALKAVSDLTTHFYRLSRGASFLIPVLNASPYLELFGDIAVGSLLMEAATIANEKSNAIYTEKEAKGSKAKQRALMRENKEVAFYHGKIAAAKFFASNVLSTVKARCELSINYIRRVMNLIIRFLRRSKMTSSRSIAPDSARIKAAPGTKSASHDREADGTASNCTSASMYIQGWCTRSPSPDGTDMIVESSHVSLNTFQS